MIDLSTNYSSSWQAESGLTGKCPIRVRLLGAALGRRPDSLPYRHAGQVSVFYADSPAPAAARQAMMPAADGITPRLAAKRQIGGR